MLGESEGRGQERLRHPEPYLTTAMRTEEIERYLTRQMAGEECEAFEREMQEQPQLREDVKIVAWTIEAIRERGQQEDAESIRRMREQMGSDNKRYKATVAAVIGGVLVVAAMTAVSIPPIYNHVIKPVIESVFGNGSTGQVTPQQPPSTASIDSLTSSASADSMDVDSPAEEEDGTLPEEPQQADETPATEEKPQQQTVKEELTKEEPDKPAVEEERKEPEAKKEENAKEAKTSSNSSNVDIRQLVGNTEYHLTRIDYDNKGNLVAYFILLNNKESIDFELSQMPKVNIDGYEKTAYRVTADGATTQNFKLRKRQPVSLVIYFSGVKTGAKTINLLQVKNANEYKSLQMKNISVN